MRAPIFRPRINPALHRFPAEAAIIGRIVVAFGELEYLVTICAGRALGDKYRAQKALYRLRTTSSRVDVAETFIRAITDDSAHEELVSETFSATRHCLQFRNHYAHCNWGDADTASGLFFVDLEESARQTKAFDLFWRHTDVNLLEAQEAYFAYSQGLLYHLEYQLSAIQGIPIYPASPRPLNHVLPPLHNPPEQHVPPWIDEDQKALHLARARAANGGTPTPTPAQLAMERARAEKRARQAENNRRAQDGEDRANARSDPPKSD